MSFFIYFFVLFCFTSLLSCSCCLQLIEAFSFSSFSERHKQVIFCPCTCRLYQKKHLDWKSKTSCSVAAAVLISGCGLPTSTCLVQKHSVSHLSTLLRSSPGPVWPQGAGTLEGSPRRPLPVPESAVWRWGTRWSAGGTDRLSVLDGGEKKEPHVSHVLASVHSQCESIQSETQTDHEKAKTRSCWPMIFTVSK